MANPSKVKDCLGAHHESEPPGSLILAVVAGLAVLGVLVVLGSPTGARAATGSALGASEAQASRVVRFVSASAVTGLTPTLAEELAGVASRHGGHATLLRQGTVDLLSTHRGPRTVALPPQGYDYPIATRTIDDTVAEVFVGTEAAQAIRRGLGVVGETSARLRHVRVGDSLIIRRWTTLSAGAEPADSNAEQPLASDPPNSAVAHLPANTRSTDEAVATSPTLAVSPTRSIAVPNRRLPTDVPPSSSVGESAISTTLASTPSTALTTALTTMATSGLGGAARTSADPAYDPLSDPASEIVSVVVGAIVSDTDTLGSELLLSEKSGSAMGLNRLDRVLLWDFHDDAAVIGETSAIVGTRFVQASWEDDTIDSVLSAASLKTLAGEFAVRRTATGDLEIEPGWIEHNVRAVDLPIIGPVRCHRLLAGPLQAALGEIERAGLGPLLDVQDTRTSGGCLSVRAIRSVSGSQGRNLSRHSWAVALDINPSTNRYGSVPTIDMRIVDVFRRNGFAWGGSFPITDGMHFEFIGKPRVTGPTLPSAPPTVATTSTTTTSTTTTSSAATSTTTTTLTTTTPTSTALATPASTAASTATTSNTTGSKPGLTRPTTTTSNPATAPAPSTAPVPGTAPNTPPSSDTATTTVAGTSSTSVVPSPTEVAGASVAEGS